METKLYNYYDVLEVSPHCQQHEITAAYERAKSTYSGDNPAIYTIFSQQEARELLKLVDEAYSILGNKTLRAIYDEKVSSNNVKPEDLTLESLKNQSKIVIPDLQKKVPTKIEFNFDSKMEEEILSCTDWDGSMIKKVREYKKMPLERVSEVTKISAYYINAVENMDPTNLPAAVFVRGYVSQICKVLALDDKKVPESYMKIYKNRVAKN